ncbi:hypothetical protein A2U01_0060183, partial [Trifolium medium]|nr:hypothetical protein [Trifolium medium]
PQPPPPSYAVPCHTVNHLPNLPSPLPQHQPHDVHAQGRPHDAQSEQPKAEPDACVSAS